MDTISKLKLLEGQFCFKHVVEGTSSLMVLYTCTKFRENISKGFKGYLAGTSCGVQTDRQLWENNISPSKWKA